MTGAPVTLEQTIAFPLKNEEAALINPIEAKRSLIVCWHLVAAASVFIFYGIRNEPKLKSMTRNVMSSDELHA